MGLRDEILAEQGQKGAKCSVYKFLKELGTEELKELESVMADLSVTSSAIANYYKKQGHPISQYSLQRHRRGACQCQENNNVSK